MQKLLEQERDNCGFGLIANCDNNPTHAILQKAISSLERMIHRGAISSDGKSADGSGLLLSMPRKFMQKVAKKEGFELPNKYAVGVFFIKDMNCLTDIEKISNNNNLKVIGTREVETNTDVIGEKAKQSMPHIIQVFFSAENLPDIRFEAMLYLTRKEIQTHFAYDDDFYVCSLSHNTISYKGLVMPTHIKEFFIDFQDEDFEISFALFHQRFSTNTLPKWRLAQPFRMIAHNGEINSIKANRFNAKIKSENAKSKIFSDKELNKLMPIIDPVGSDSASLDNFFEFLTINGVDFLKAVRMVIPFPWQNQSHLSTSLQSFYEYTSVFCEAWDGPAAVSFTNGKYIGCVLDRNGLRPAKYTIYNDNTFVVSSEHGILDIEEEDIKDRGRLKSGEMIALDLEHNKILFNEDINKHISNSAPYEKWLNKNANYFEEYLEENFNDLDNYKIEDLTNKQKFFNITVEAINEVIVPMADTAKENVGSMGDDTPISAFSTKQRSFFDFFRQKFAQVTNPAIDPYREKIVMSLNTFFGEMGNILEETPSHAKRFNASSPVIIENKLNFIMQCSEHKDKQISKIMKSKSYSTAYTNNLEKSINSLIERITLDIKQNNIKIIVLDDREINEQNKIIPIAMIVGKLNYSLLDEKIRSRVSIIAISGEVIDTHSMAVLISLGARAIYPYMIFNTIADRYKDLSDSEIQEKLINASNTLKGGILKIMSKIGISTVYSYRNSYSHDILGLSKTIVDECFRDCNSLLHGLSYEDIDKRITKAHKDAYLDTGRTLPVNIGGFYHYVKDEEYHDFSPSVVYAIQKASITGKKEDFQALKDIIDTRDKKFVRDFLKFNTNNKSIDISEVEDRSQILKRFSTAAMSLGAISPEAHETLAEAMNILGGKSNSGEGGEKVERFKTIKNSKIKQVASGRFGVTPEYLSSASEIQIKLAQGAKPGEGGQLPGTKVSKLIAKIRFTTPGITLISPPPHHDIYSIEDLAQLIFDLKQINPRATIAVKLVSSLGVGVIATGVAKAYADKIIISGNDGGTGAAPLSSIKYAGNPFELGLIEAHKALKINHLRELVTLECDGGLKTGLDIVKAAIMGAENFAFGTPALVVIGCKFLRVCHLNKCAVGVATQNKTLRELFVGDVDRVVNYFTLLAEDIREILAQIGYKSLNDVIGKIELLDVIKEEDNQISSKIDFSSLLETVDGVDICTHESNKPMDNNEFEQNIIQSLSGIIDGDETSKEINISIQNINRSFGARLSGEIVQRYGNYGFGKNITINLKGFAGQSFGAFLIQGITLKLDGCANDYVGKGMNGGSIIIKTSLDDSVNTIGNTCLYGATGGKLFINGNAGERFGVRNSGAIAVTNGVGDHACEYMTGGIVVVLGETGINFGAGMTGGAAFIYDKNNNFISKINRELVEHLRIDVDDLFQERFYLRKLLQQYYNETKNKRAKIILDNFRSSVKNFWLVKPKDLSKIPLSPYEVD